LKSAERQPAEPVARECRRREAHGRGGVWGFSLKKFRKIDCLTAINFSSIFQAFQALSSHFKGVGNSNETAGRTELQRPIGGRPPPPPAPMNPPLISGTVFRDQMTQQTVSEKSQLVIKIQSHHNHSTVSQ